MQARDADDVGFENEVLEDELDTAEHPSDTLVNESPAATSDGGDLGGASVIVIREIGRGGDDDD